MSSISGTVFRDLLLTLVILFVVLVAVMLPFLQPPGAKKDEETRSPGFMQVEARWPDGWATDVDLWVQAPGDVPVGYSNKGGRVFNLLRDDLGQRADDLELNYENAYSRSLPAGVYTVNVHLYRNSAGTLPVPIQVRVTVRDARGRALPIMLSDVELRAVGEELTVFSFRIDTEGRIVPGSVSLVPVSLRSARS